MDKHQVMALMQAPMDSQSMKINALQTGIGYDNQTAIGAFQFWQTDYYPRVIKESYPVYIQERARDKGKQAFEIIKVLKDKKLVDMRKVGDFIDLMDELIKIL